MLGDFVFMIQILAYFLHVVHNVGLYIWDINERILFYF